MDNQQLKALLEDHTGRSTDEETTRVANEIIRESEILAAANFKRTMKRFYHEVRADVHAHRKALAVTK